MHNDLESLTLRRKRRLIDIQGAAICCQVLLLSDIRTALICGADALTLMRRAADTRQECTI